MHRAHALRRWLRRRSTGLAQRSLVLFVLLTLLVPVAAGGMPYVWCIGTARAQLSCCCHGRHAEAAGDHHAAKTDAIEATCCIDQHIDRVPASNTAIDHVPAVAPAPTYVTWLTLAMLLPATVEPETSSHVRYEREARAGPEPPLYAIDCAYLN